jgi:hypothetical protein
MFFFIQGVFLDVYVYCFQVLPIVNYARQMPFAAQHHTGAQIAGTNLLLTVADLVTFPEGEYIHF